MRTEVKAGIIVGLVVVAALIIYVSSQPQTGREDVPIDNPNRADTRLAAAENADDDDAPRSARATETRRATSPTGPVGAKTPQRPPSRSKPSATRPPTKSASEQRTTRVTTPTAKRSSPAPQRPSATAQRSPLTPNTGLSKPDQSAEPGAAGLDLLRRIRAQSAAAGQDADRAAPPTKPAADANAAQRRTAAATPAGSALKPGATAFSPSRAVRTPVSPQRSASASPPSRSSTAAPPTRTDSNRAASDRAETYVIRGGDKLILIARDHYGDGKYWTAIAAANPGLNPSAMKIGQKIKLPPKAQVVSGTKPSTRTAANKPPAGQAWTYVVERGDSLSSIAGDVLKDRGKWKQIYELNKDQLDSPDRIRIGMKLKMPPRP